MSLSYVFRSKCHRSPFSLYRIWQLTLIAIYLGNLTFPKVQTILFRNTLSQTNNLLPFSRKSVLFIFSTLYNLNIYLWPLKSHNFKSMCRISKIITFVESLRQAGWFDIFESDIQTLLIFDPLITLWGNLDAPYLKLLNDASMASACSYANTCRRVRNSQKIATIRDFHLPGSFLCLSTRLYGEECTNEGHGGNCLGYLPLIWLVPALIYTTLNTCIFVLWTRNKNFAISWLGNFPIFPGWDSC